MIGRSACLLLLSLGLFQSTFAAKPKVPFFPTGWLDEGEWYSPHLAAMKEPPLWPLAKDPSVSTFRFLWLRTFHHPVVIRLQILTKQPSFLMVKELDGQGGYRPGKLITSQRLLLDEKWVEGMAQAIKRSGFWTMTPLEENHGLDGAQWILEGVERGKYQLVDRWSPKSGPFKDAMLYWLKVSGLKLNPDDVY